MKFLRVSKKKPCAICGKPDYCGVSPEGDAAICMRVRSDKQTRNGGWLHRIGFAQGVPAQPEVKQSKLAPPDTLDQVYCDLKSKLVLSNSHKEKLVARGLSESEIESRGYRSVPAETFATYTAKALSLTHDLRGVPGFYFDKVWKLSHVGAGFYVPVRDSKHRIRGFQVRRDEGTPRYLWLSSAGKPEGVSSGAPVHFAHPERIEGQLIVTEGALKADVIAERLGCAVVGLAGLNFPPSFSSKLRRRFPSLREVRVAFDSDFRTNDAVRAAIFRLITDARLAYLRASVWTWEGAKGFDDLLARSAA